MTAVVILAGGKSSRMGTDKLKLLYQGETFLSAAVRRFSQSFDTVFLSLREPEKYPEIACRRAVDVYPGCGPMSGIHAAMREADADIFAVAGDMPFSDPVIAQKLVSLSEGYDAVVPRREDGSIEPLFAWYSKSLLNKLEESLRGGRYKLAELLGELNVNYVDTAALTDSDKLFDNINRPEDYSRITGYGGN